MSYEGMHLSLSDIKEDHPDNQYLRKERTVNYPKCVYHVAKVSHVTDLKGLQGIFLDRGFRKGKEDDFVWWSLHATADDCVDAEIDIGSQRFSWQNPNKMSFLDKFTTSPAFQREKSLYGNFCFTFDLKYLLHMYSQQRCCRTAPILRVMDTKLYKKEIVYSTVVHSRYLKRYRSYRRLPINDTFLCGYGQKKMSWRCQSPSDNYKHYLDVGNEVGEVNPCLLESPVYYVWDHVALAFHMEQDRVLRLGHRRLFDSLSVCETTPNNGMSVNEAKAEIEKLKQRYLL